LGDTVTREESVWWKSGTAVVAWIAVGTVVVHLATGWRYGFDRDELMALEDARHLAWGYVQYPPMTAFLGRVALELFGTSLVGFRFFAALAQALAVVLTGLMAKEIWRAAASDEWGPAFAEATAGEVVSGRKKRRPEVEELEKPKTHPSQLRVDHQKTRTVRTGTAGEKFAMVVAAMAAVPFCLGAGTLMQYISFDYVCWVWVAYCVVKIVVSGEWRVAEGLLSASGRRGILHSADYVRNDGVFFGGPLDEEPKTHPHKTRMGHPEEESERAGEWWWVGVGVGIGLGMMAKYTMLFLVAGLMVGVLLTPARRYLRSGWLWLGVAVAVGIFLPNFVWQWKREFVSLEFLRFLHVRDVGEGLTDWFLLGQLEITLLAAPLAVAGLWFCFFTQEGKRFRILGWMYLVPLVLFLVMRGREYYLAPGYPMLYAAGAVWVGRKWRVAGDEWREEKSEEELRSESDRRGVAHSADFVRNDGKFLGGLSEKYPKTHPHKTRMGHPAEAATWRDRRGVAQSAGSVRNDVAFSGRWMKVIWVCLVLDVIVAGAVALPIAPVNSGWWKFASRVDSVFPEEIGWPEFVEGVAAVRDRLPAEERGRVGILAGNYGEVGALNLYGEKFGLPWAISGVNSSWERGYGNPAPETVIVVGYPREFLEEEFASCVVAGRTWNRYRVMNEETMEDPEIFVCRGLKGSWKEFWGKARRFA